MKDWSIVIIATTLVLASALSTCSLVELIIYDRLVAFWVFIFLASARVIELCCSASFSLHNLKDRVYRLGLMHSSSNLYQHELGLLPFLS